MEKLKIEKVLKINVFIKLRKQNRQKGRVSVPATFRSYLSTKKNDGFVAYPSFNHAALRACTKDRIEKLSSNTIDLAKSF